MDNWLADNDWSYASMADDYVDDGLCPLSQPVFSDDYAPLPDTHGLTMHGWQHDFNVLRRTKAKNTHRAKVWLKWGVYLNDSQLTTWADRKGYKPIAHPNAISWDMGNLFDDLK